VACVNRRSWIPWQQLPTAAHTRTRRLADMQASPRCPVDCSLTVTTTGSPGPEARSSVTSAIQDMVPGSTGKPASSATAQSETSQERSPPISPMASPRQPLPPTRANPTISAVAVLRPGGRQPGGRGRLAGVLRGPTARGLFGVRLVISDVHRGLVDAIAATLSVASSSRPERYRSFRSSSRRRDAACSRGRSTAPEHC